MRRWLVTTSRSFTAVGAQMAWLMASALRRAGDEADLVLPLVDALGPMASDRSVPVWAAPEGRLDDATRAARAAAATPWEQSGLAQEGPGRLAGWAWLLRAIRPTHLLVLEFPALVSLLQGALPLAHLRVLGDPLPEHPVLASWRAQHDLPDRGAPGAAWALSPASWVPELGGLPAMAVPALPTGGTQPTALLTAGFRHGTAAGTQLRQAGFPGVLRRALAAPDGLPAEALDLRQLHGRPLLHEGHPLLVLSAWRAGLPQGIVSPLAERRRFLEAAARQGVAHLAPGRPQPAWWQRLPPPPPAPSAPDLVGALRGWG